MSTKFSSPVPVGSRLTSGFSPKRRLFGIIQPHAGTDWAPPKPGQHVAVYAVADGRVTATGVGVLPGHSGQIIVIDHGVLTDSTGSDRTYTNYGHLYRIDVRVGDYVKAGEQIALMGATGNVTGVHLHLGVRFNGVYSNPATWLKKKGITPGKTAPITQSIVISPVGSVKPKPKPSTPIAGYSKRTLNIQNALDNMGYHIVKDGKMGPDTKATIKEYQKSQKAPYTLLADGVWGAKTTAHYVWTKKLQAAMNKWRSSTRDIRVDGHYGSNTVAKIRDLQKRNKGRAYKGIVDGVPGRVFCKMLKIVTHP